MTWVLEETAFSDAFWDPYFDWIRGPGAADFLTDERQRVPVLHRLEGDRESLEALDARLRRLYGPDNPRSSVYVAQDFRAALYLTVLARPGDLPDPESLRSAVGLLDSGPMQISFGAPLPESSVNPEPVDIGPGPEVPPAETESTLRPVVGIIDDGIAFAHRRFRRAPDQTRIEHLWLQEEPSIGTLPIGRELTKADIDALFAQCGGAAEAIDEDRLYRLAGVTEFSRPQHKPLAWRLSHGAHVMDLACGWDPEDAPDWPIVGVQLPVGVTANSSGGSLRPYAIAAIAYIVARAKAIALARKCGPLPVVINFSYGLVAGPHDGTDLLEAFIDDFVKAHNATKGNAPLRVVIPSGNSHLARAHAKLCFAKEGHRQTLRWRLQPDDRTPSFLEIWLPAASKKASRLRLTITPPNGPVSLVLAEGEVQVLKWKPHGEVLCLARYRFVPKPTVRGMFLIALQPTARLESGPRAPSGIWEITLENIELGASEEVHAWIQRDDNPYGYSRGGRQSTFDHPCYRRFDHAGREIEVDDPDCVVQRAGSMNAIATGREPVVIGGLLRKEVRPAKYSAGGPITTPVGSPAHHRDGPDVMAASDDSVVRGGVLGAGTRSGSVVAMNGTSVAAPRVARWIACEFAEYRDGDRDAVQDLAASYEAAPGLPAQPSPERGGAGRLRLPPVIERP